MSGMDTATQEWSAAVDAAFLLLSRRRWKEAEEALMPLAASDEADARVLFGLGRALAGQKLSAAEEPLRRSLQIDADNVEARLELARLMRLLRRQDDAMAECRLVLRAAPNSVPAMELLAHILRGQKAYDEAEQLLRRALTIDPDHHSINCQLAEFLSLYGSDAEAVEVARHVVARHPRSARAAFTLGMVHARARRFVDAVLELERAVSLDPTDQVARKELSAARRFVNAVGTKPRLAVWPRRSAAFQDIEKLIRDHVLTDSRPSQPLLDQGSRVVAIGSCFAGHIAQRLHDRDLDVYYRPIGEEINNTYANRYLIDWICNGPVDDETRELEAIYGESERNAFRSHFVDVDVVVFTLGVAPCFFERETGRFVFAHGSTIETKLLPELCDFRTTTVEENVGNVRHIIAGIKTLSPKARFVLTVSPVPLAATYEMGSAVLADAVSKSVMRLAVHELLKERRPDIFYWPSFEIVRWLGSYMPPGTPPVFANDDGNTRHVSVWMVDMIMRLFIEYCGDSALQQPLKRAV